jgi:muramoyltetrapeptide carboxypeptidase LdcA involved in peptidoglycan recycling
MSKQITQEEIVERQKKAYLKGAATQLAASGVKVEKAKPMVRKLEKLAGDRQVRAEAIRAAIAEHAKG